MVAKTQAATLVAPKQFELREYDVPELTSETGLMKVELLEISTHQFPLPEVRHALDTAAGEGEPGAIHVTLLP